MTPTTFLRLLPIPIDAKGDVLAERIAALNAAGRAEDVFILDPAAFAQIPGSPFAYWANESIRYLFERLPAVETEGRAVRLGDHPDNQDRYLRLFWEVPAQDRSTNRRWLLYQKGGAYSPYYSDIHLIVDWDMERETYYAFYGRPGRSTIHPSNYQFFLRRGLTWPRRTTSGISIRVLPGGCIFADKGPAVFVPNDEPDRLLALLAVMNSTPFASLVKLQLGAATAAARSYEVGVIQRTPVPSLSDDRSRIALAALAREAHDLQRDRDRIDETTHAFALPGLVQQYSAPSLAAVSQALDAAEQSRLARLAAIQAEIDESVMKLYGLTADDLRLSASGEAGLTVAEPIDNRQSEIVNEDDEEEDPAIADTLPRRVADLLQWCVGVAFGRWDVRMALDPSLLPALAGPFDPLPRCAPGALVGVDGLPPTAVDAIAPDAWLRTRRTVLDIPPWPAVSITDGHSPVTAHLLPFPEDGILVDDPTHPSDIVARVRQVLRLLWDEQADAVEQEACQALGVRDLRAWFRDPRQGFFAYHIKRYSKSRRKAPIYWLLQSERRNYAIWLYCHRLHKHSLYVAGRDYADAKVRLEETRLAELREGLDTAAAAYSTGGSAARRQREREIERQEKLVAEVAAFRNTLDQIALRNLPPDLNDGVLISVAPLHPLMPWKEAERMWDALVKGEYGWSAMSRQMQEKGLVD